MIQDRFPWRYAAGLLIACALGTVLILPYDIEIMRINADPPGTLVWKPKEFTVEVVYQGRTDHWGPAEVVVNLVFESVVSLLAIFLGLKLGRPLGLAWPPLNGFEPGPKRLRRTAFTLALSTLLGAASALLIWGLLRLSTPNAGDDAKSLVEPVWWTGLLASFAAGVREEVWLRLGVLTTIVWCLAKLTRRKLSGSILVWTGIILTSLLFGLMHLPKASRLLPLTPLVIAVVLLLNGLIGLLFGWLYWRKGLLAAMAAHVAQDIMTHVVLPLIG